MPSLRRPAPPAWLSGRRPPGRVRPAPRTGRFGWSRVQGPLGGPADPDPHRGFSFLVRELIPSDRPRVFWGGEWGPRQWRSLLFISASVPPWSSSRPWLASRPVRTDRTPPVDCRRWRQTRPIRSVKTVPDRNQGPWASFRTAKTEWARLRPRHTARPTSPLNRVGREQSGERLGATAGCRNHISFGSCWTGSPDGSARRGHGQPPGRLPGDPGGRRTLTLARKWD